MRTVVFVLFFSLSSFVFANEWVFNAKCERAIDNETFQRGSAGIKAGAHSVANMSSILTDDQSDRAVLVIWQVSTALSEINKLRTLKLLRPMIVAQKQKEADAIMSIHVDSSISAFENVSKQIDTSLLIIRNAGMREELRGIRGSLDQILSALKVCKR